MIIFGVISVWLVCFVGEVRGFKVDLGRISYGYSEVKNVSIITFYHSVKGYSMKLRCTNCFNFDGARIYCAGGALVNVTVELYRGNEHVYVPFNVSCDKARNDELVINLKGVPQAQSVQLSWGVDRRSSRRDRDRYRYMDRYVVYYMTEGKYHYKVAMTQSKSFLLEGLNERTSYRICVATIDGRSVTGMYTCLIQEVDSSDIKSVTILWQKPKYDPSGYIIDYRDTRRGFCGIIIIKMRISEGVLNKNETPHGCVWKREYNWTHLQPLTITDLLSYTLYNITILPVIRGRIQTGVIKSMRTKEGRSGKVDNLRTTTVGEWLRIEYDAPPQPNVVITGYRVRVLLMRRGICDQGRKQIIGSSAVTSTHHDVPLKSLTRCGQYAIEVSPINGLDGGVGEPASTVFDYRPDSSPTISYTNVSVVSSNLVRISWNHINYEDDCPKIGFFVEVANKDDTADCISQIIYDGVCPQLDDMLRKVSQCRHNETKSVTNTGPSWTVYIGGLFRPSVAYGVRIWKISNGVLSHNEPLSFLGTDGGCFTDCYSRTYVGVRSHQGCVGWRNSSWSWTHPSKADSICALQGGSRPWCGTKTSYAYCDIPRCSRTTHITGCVRDVREVTGTSKTTVTWKPPHHEPSIIGYITILHNFEGICERSHIQMCETCGDEVRLGNQVKTLFVSCRNTTGGKGALYATTFNGLQPNSTYTVYIIPLLTSSQAGEVRNISIRTAPLKEMVKKIAFFSGSRTDVVDGTPADRTLVFDWPVTNVANAYSSVTGEFTSPISGVFAFSITISAQLGTNTSVSLLKDNEHVLDIRNSGSSLCSSSVQAILGVKKGGRVSLQYSKEAIPLRGHMYSTFSGYLLFDLP